LILRLHSLLAAPAGAASKSVFPLPKICKILFGGLYLKMREPFLPARPKSNDEGGSETPAAFRKIPNRSAVVKTLADKSGGAGRKGVEGEGNSRPALAFRKNFAAELILQKF
jgi:hypothetical protein